MSSSTSFEVHELSGRPPSLLRLTDWPLRDGGWSARSILLASLAIALLAGWTAGSVGVGAVCLLAINLALWRLWIPISYEIGPRGVTQVIFRSRRRIPWRLIAEYQIRRQGILLLAVPGTSTLAVLRSTYIRWGGQREELLAVVKYYLGSRFVS